MEAYQQLEREWADLHGVDRDRTVACATGTAALHLALEVLRLPSNTRILIPDFTMVACPAAARLAGLEPVFVDCGNDLNMDAELLERMCSDMCEWRDPPRTVMAVHVYGRRCHIDEVHRIARLYFLQVVEDMAEMPGVAPHEESAAACWSLYRNKIIAGAEGGIAWFRSKEHAKLARSLRCLGFTEAHDFKHLPRGCNYRLSNVHAELALSSLRDYKENLRKRRSLEALLDAMCPAPWRMPPRDAPWVYDFRIPNMSASDQQIIVDLMKRRGIQARHSFKPMHVQQEFAGCKCIGGEEAERASREVVYLPLDPTLDASIARTAFRNIKLRTAGC